ncbi:unnamed protein product [Cuscuta epithymum]|uniref:Protein EARLY FLOWERING 4 domain-containing protein n=1 Tax=Cuscuta epithymum TaxID=186058 RepID=A0AAV0BYW9_9ASTE|nr:unnamed protein product [Cuscuta epithymum]
MEEHMSNHHRRQSLTTNTQFPTTAATGGTSTNKRRLGGDGEDQGESAVWKAFERNFEEVQSALDRNRVLIQQVNENQWSRIHENLVENVSLIQEINANICKVVSLYSGFSGNFAGAFSQQNGAAADGQNGAYKSFPSI